MALRIVISTGDFQIRWNVLSLSFSESGKWPVGLSNFIVTISSVMIVFGHCSLIMHGFHNGK